MNCKDISNSSSVISIFAESIKCWQGTTFVVQGATFCSGSYIKPVLCCTNQFPHPEDFSCFSLNYVNISNHLHKSRSSKFSGSLSGKPRPDFFPYLYNQDITSRITLTWGRPTYLKSNTPCSYVKIWPISLGKLAKQKTLFTKKMWTSDGESSLEWLADQRVLNKCINVSSRRSQKSPKQHLTHCRPHLTHLRSYDTR